MTPELPEKFKGKTAEEIAAMYVELESHSSKTINDLKAKAGERVPAIGEHVPPAGGGAAADDEKLGKGITAKVQRAFALLREGDPKALELFNELGIDPDSSAYAMEISVEAQKKYVEDVYEMMGGKEAYAEAVRWVNETDKLSKFEKADILRELLSGKAGRTMAAARSLRQRYSELEQCEASEAVIAVPGGQAEAVRPFADDGEIERAYADPKYKTDSAYREKVDARMRRTNIQMAVDAGRGVAV